VTLDLLRPEHAKGVETPDWIFSRTEDNHPAFTALESGNLLVNDMV
jgi:hypothetical protein